MNPDLLAEIRRSLTTPTYEPVPWSQAARAIEDDLLNRVPIYFGIPSPEMRTALDERYGQGNWRTVGSYYTRERERNRFIEPSYVTTPAFTDSLTRNVYGRVTGSMDVPMSPNGCALCGVSFLIPTGLMESRRGSAELVFCPNGHPLRITNPDGDKKTRRIRDLEAQVRDLQAWVHRAGHLFTCGITPSSPCTCGYENLLKGVIL